MFRSHCAAIVIALRSTGLGLLALAALEVSAAGTAPEAFNFVERTGVATASFITSESRRPSGFEGTLQVSVSGAGDPQYRIDNGTFTNSPGPLAPGQTLTVRHLSAAEVGTATVSAVSVGSYSTPFRSVTTADDRTPDAFGFGTRGNVPADTEVESPAIVLGGFTAPASIAAPAPGVQYRIGNAPYTSAAGSLPVGARLTVKHRSHATRLGYTRSTLRVGGVTGSFTTRTLGSIAPAAVDDVFKVNQDTALTLAAPGVLGNDAHGTPLTAAIAAAPAQGSVTLAADGSFVYTPVAAFTGTDQFTYTVSDGSARSSPATVRITVTAVTTVQRVSSLTLAMLPDTQYYSEGSPQSYEAQTRWLAANAAAIGKPFVMHLGDIVQSPTIDAEWRSASRAMGFLDSAALPYSLAPGNHDLANTGEDAGRNRANEYFPRYFPNSRAAQLATFGGRDPLGFSEYHIIEAEGIRFLVMALDWRTSAATRSWAQGVLTANPKLPTIITSHDIAVPAADGTATLAANGNTLWSALVANNNQVFMVLSGHYSGDGKLVRNNAAGNPVLVMVTDFQSEYAGGNGWMKFLELDFARDTIESLVFSPAIYEKFRARGVGALSPNDAVELTAARSKYVLPFGLRARFTGIGVELPAGITEPQPSQLDSIRKQIAQVPAPPSLASLPAPKDADDYPKVPGTVAHWRFEQSSPGNIVLATATVPDISGNGNTLSREDTTVSAPNTLQWSTARARLSASAGSTCYSSPNALGGGYWRTAAGTPLANATFPDGYTIEAFVQLPAGYNHGFSGIVTRIDSGGDAGRTAGDLSEPAALLGVSGSREVQFATFPLNVAGIATAWSSPLAETQWFHLAATNDGHATRLYIDGFPAGRDPVYFDMAGLAAGGKGFYVGASHYAGRQSVFSGCIGEVRIVDHVLQPSEFLIRRKP